MSGEGAASPGTSAYFLESIVAFQRSLKAAISISETRMGIKHTGRQNRALFVFAKLISHNMTLSSCLQYFQENPESSFLDHFSVAVLGRAAFDAALMTMYISQPSLSRDEWNLRRHVLFLHDLINRKRFLASLGKLMPTKPPAPFFDGYEDMKRELIDDISRHAKSLSLSPDRIVKLTEGQVVFVDGARGAAREAGWLVDHFDFLQTYWSAYVHSHPVSFLRADEHGISFDKPSSFQQNFCALVLENVGQITADVNVRMDAFTGAADRDPLGQID